MHDNEYAEATTRRQIFKQKGRYADKTTFIRTDRQICIHTTQMHTQTNIDIKIDIQTDMQTYRHRERREKRETQRKER
jgi:hypothetical protein